MKYCPQCGAEYREEIAHCADCEVALVSGEAYAREVRRQEEARERLAREEFVTVKVAENPFEAERLKNALEQEGIAVLVRTFHDTAYNGIYEAQKGYGNVEVPESERERAEKVVSDLAGAFEEE